MQNTGENNITIIREWWLLVGIIINTFITVWGFDQHIGADPIGWIRHGNWSDRHWKEEKTTTLTITITMIITTTLTLTAVYCNNTKGVSDNNTMVTHMRKQVFYIYGIRFMRQYAKSFSFFFSIVLFFVVALLIGGQQMKLNKRLFGPCGCWPAPWRVIVTKGPIHDVLKIW